MKPSMDDFIDDLDDLSSEDGNDSSMPLNNGGSWADNGNGNGNSNGNGNGNGNAIDGANGNGSSSLPPPPSLSSSVILEKSIETVCTLLRNPKFLDHLSSLESSSNQSDKMSFSSDSHSIIESPDYRRILESNVYLTDLEEELTKACNFVKEVYRPRFPELEEIVVSSRMDYCRVLRCIGNTMDISEKTEELNSILKPNVVIMISVSASTGNLKELGEEDLKKVDAACTEMESISSHMSTLQSFVESRMMTIAPNCCALVGSSITARLMGLAGGLDALSRVPSCNLQVFGQKKLTASARAGFGSQHARPNFGIIGECDLVESVMEADKKKALKNVSAKLILCARCDAVNSGAGREGNSATGDGFRVDLEKKFNKWEEPDKARIKKALPKPEMAAKKKRAGKRVRKEKEKYALTEVHKAANKRSFMEINGEYGDDAMGLDMGQLGDAKVGGTMRGVQATQKMKLNNNGKEGKRRAVRMSGSSGSTDGLASSMVFTQTQGLELVAPKKKVDAANEKWFGTNSGFMSAKPK